MRILRIGLLLLLVSTSLRIYATTVVVIVSKNGMAVSSDSKTGLSGSDNRVTGSIEQDKFVILNRRIVVAAIGNSGFSNDKNKFEFLDWMAKIQSELPIDASVDDVASFVEKESSTLFAAFDFGSQIKSGQLSIENRTALCTLFTEFAIFGYQDGSPRIVTVQFNVDWTSKALVGPSRSQMPMPNLHQVVLIPMGQVGAITDWSDKNSYAHSVAVELCPEAVKKFDSRKVMLSLDDEISVSRALIQVEENTNPTSVGGPIRTATILPSGHAEIFIEPESRK